MKSSHSCTFTGCERSFTSLGKLERHKKLHTDEKKFVCPQCNKKFARAFTLNRHQVIHTGQKSFICDFKNCGKAFNTSGNLARHRRIHTGQARIKCDGDFGQCRKTFTSLQKLQRHKTVKHSTDFQVDSFSNGLITRQSDCLNNEAIQIPSITTTTPIEENLSSLFDIPDTVEGDNSAESFNRALDTDILTLLSNDYEPLRSDEFLSDEIVQFLGDTKCIPFEEKLPISDAERVYRCVEDLYSGLIQEHPIERILAQAIQAGNEIKIAIDRVKSREQQLEKWMEAVSAVIEVSPQVSTLTTHFRQALISEQYCLRQISQQLETLNNDMRTYFSFSECKRHLLAALISIRKNITKYVEFTQYTIWADDELLHRVNSELYCIDSQAVSRLELPKVGSNGVVFEGDHVVIMDL